MIQRKQTIYLLLALAALIVCLCLPIGEVRLKSMGASPVWYNIGVYTGESFLAKPLPFVDLVVVGALTFIDIFLYKRRLMQARICVAGIILSLAWYGYYAFCAFGEFAAMGNFHFGFAACLPLVAIIFLLMARQGIKADENLIRSMDRIR